MKSNRMAIANHQLIEMEIFLSRAQNLYKT